HLANTGLDVGLRILEDVFYLAALDAACLVNFLDRCLNGPTPPDTVGRQSPGHTELGPKLERFVLPPEEWRLQGKGCCASSSAGQECLTGDALRCGLVHGCSSLSTCLGKRCGIVAGP